MAIVSPTVEWPADAKWPQLMGLTPFTYHEDDLQRSSMAFLRSSPTGSLRASPKASSHAFPKSVAAVHASPQIPSLVKERHAHRGADGSKRALQGYIFHM